LDFWYAVSLPQYFLLLDGRYFAAQIVYGQRYNELHTTSLGRYMKGFGMDDWEGHTCHSIGISGNCGLDCPVLLRGDCESEDEMYDDVKIINPTPITHSIKRWKF